MQRATFPSRVALTALLGLVLLPAIVSAQGPLRIRIKGNGVDLAATPLLTEVRGELPEANYRIYPSDAGKPSSANVFKLNGKTWIGLIIDQLKAEGERTYELVPMTGVDPVPPGVLLKKSSGGNVSVELDGKPFTEYRLDQGSKPIYFPVIGPTGDRSTRAYPIEKVDGEDKDHPHQRSFWFTHGSVNGVDFWASDPMNGTKPNFGAIKETSRLAEVSGRALGALVTTDDWLSGDGKKVCDDRRVVRFWGIADPRVIDFEITINASAGAVTLGDTKEGMFGLRVPSSMDVKRKTGGRITNAEGITDLEAWGKASPWVDYTGPVADKTLGIAILNHPESFRYPTTWHVRDYGLFAANPFGWKDFGRKESGEFTIPAGGSISFKYRVIFHTGDTKSSNIAAQFQAYAQPPKIEWLGE
jgi:hypothetical protein